MLIPRQARHVRWMAIATFPLVLLVGLWIVMHQQERGLPYHDSFAHGRADEWKALGGTWNLRGSVMRNDSDERGAKLLTGSPDWRNYSIEADVMLLGENGDAGLVIRSNREEEGVDSYAGYYAGLREHDSSLVLGRASYGWMENSSQISQTGGDIQALHWYHLKLLAYDCHIVASVGLPSGAVFKSMAVTDHDCIHAGRVGLRSYSSGGAWKDVVVRRAGRNDLTAMLEARNTQMEATMQTMSSGNPETADMEAPLNAEAALPSENTLPLLQIGSLRLSAFTGKDTARVEGVVILTSPVLVVEDSTGGVFLRHASGPPLKVGDEVEVIGQVHPADFSAVIEDATVRILWSRTPDPAVAVTALQAATGAFDARFIEVEGQLTGKSIDPSGSHVLEIQAGQQSFRAIMSPGRGDDLFAGLRRNSLVRLRGICIVSSSYTHDLTPFVLLLRSGDDLKVLSGPPWWSAAHVAGLVIGVLFLALIATFVWSRAEAWRHHAVSAERERLALEMHDTLSQSFAGLGFQLEAIRSGLPNELNAAHQQLNLASELVRHSHEEARRSIHSLRPDGGPFIESGDLAPALEACALRMVAGGTMRITSRSIGDPRPIPKKMAVTLYRIAQEAVANAIRHGAPTCIAITVEYGRRWVRVVISDDGAGFTETGDLRGFGIRGMRKRAAAISAGLYIRSLQPHGTCVTIAADLPRRVPFLSQFRSLFKLILEHRQRAREKQRRHSYSYRG